MIARLPPKQIMLETFIEERRRKLQIWLILVSQHPVYARDEMLRIFLTEKSDRHQEMINEIGVLDSNVEDFAQKYDLKLVLEKQEAARRIFNEILKIKRLINQQFKRQIEIVDDFHSLSHSLSSIIQQSYDDKSFDDYSQNFLKIYNDFDKEARENQQVAVTERIELVIEIFTAFCDLTERIEETFKAEKTPTVVIAGNRWQKLQSAIKGTVNYEISDSDEQRERRINYAVHCVLEEFKFTLKYLKLLPSILLKFTHEQACIYSNIAKFLNNIIDVENEKLSS